MDANTITTFAPLIFIMAIFYFLIIRPQQQQAKQLRAKIDGVRRGDTVVTAGGIVGRVVKAPQTGEPEILVEIADNVQVKVLRATLSDVRVRGEPAESDVKTGAKTDKD
ncbi:MAG TPA: preprotein translocase subunit YajC [Rhizomicrobium sp.]|nr:preprotein translocase subunit YajC [Rhizomicrobium sp.]